MYDKAKSGDLCRFVGEPTMVEHYRCDEHADGTVTDPRTGEIVRHAPSGARRGFERA